MKLSEHTISVLKNYANIISPEMFNWKDASEEERQKLLQTIRGNRYRYGGGGGGLGEKRN